MKYLILLSVISLPSHAARDCVKDPLSHYEKEFALRDISLRVETVALNGDDLPDLKITSEEQCGAHGCEGLFYLQTEKNCFKDVLLFNGSVEVRKSKGPFKEIVVGKKTFHFNSLRRVYE